MQISQFVYIVTFSSCSYDGKQYLMATGKDEICQFYRITKGQAAAAPVVGKANKEEVEPNDKGRPIVQFVANSPDR